MQRGQYQNIYQAQQLATRLRVLVFKNSIYWKLIVLPITMKSLRFNLIVAMCDNRGIGMKGDLPWRLPKEMQYFSRMTKKILDPTKRNAIIMGRKTYIGIPESKRPLRDRLNIVLTRDPSMHVYPESVTVCRSLEDAIAIVEASEDIENVWIVGGSSVYEESMKSKYFHKVYLTEVMSSFECDTFFPLLTDDFKLVENDSDVTSEVQEENGIKYRYTTYEKIVPPVIA